MKSGEIFRNLRQPYPKQMSDKFVWHWQAAVLIRFKTTLNCTTITAVVLNKVGITQKWFTVKIIR